MRYSNKISSSPGNLVSRGLEIKGRNACTEKNHTAVRKILKSKVENGGEEGIRTLDTLLAYTPLAGEPLRPLGHLSNRADKENKSGNQPQSSNSKAFVVVNEIAPFPLR